LLLVNIIILFNKFNFILNGYSNYSKSVKIDGKYLVPYILPSLTECVDIPILTRVRVGYPTRTGPVRVGNGEEEELGYIKFTAYATVPFISGRVGYHSHPFYTGQEVARPRNKQFFD
jgi:hypothetical protein